MYTSIHPYIHPFIRSSIHPSIHPSICSCIRPSIHTFIRSSFQPFIHSFIHSCFPRASLFLSDSYSRACTSLVYLSYGNTINASTSIFTSSTHHFEQVRRSVSFGKIDTPSTAYVLYLVLLLKYSRVLVKQKHMNKKYANFHHV